MSSSASSFPCNLFQPDLHEHNNLFACLIHNNDETVADNYSREELLELKRSYAIKIIQNGEDIHQVVGNREETFLHYAVRIGFFDVVELLIEKGININAQDNFGSTALHRSCWECNEHLIELVPMLLYYGADPWIHDDNDRTPVDIIVIGRSVCSTTTEHLFRYMFTENEKFHIDVGTLFNMASLELPFFYEMVENIDVDISNCDSTTVCELFKISPEYLETLIEKFQWVLRHVLTMEEPSDPQYSIEIMRLESVHTLFSSCLQPECSEWFCKFGNCLVFRILRLYEMPVSSKENLIFYLLSYGMTASEDDLEVVREKFGYKTLLKLLLHLDLTKPSGLQRTNLITQILYDVTGYIQEVIDPQFWTMKAYYCCSPNDIKEILDALPYYAFSGSKYMHYGRPAEHIYKKILDHPQIPLLVELARNMFRRYFIKRLNIKSAKQFYTLVNALPISPHHKKIITLEVELY